MYDRSRYLFSAYFRPFLVISAGIIAGLLLMRLALSNGPKPESALSQPRFSIPNTGPNNGSQSNQGGALLTATPSPSYQAIIQPSTTPGNNCTYTSDYWRENPQSWMTDNIVIGQYTFTKEEALQILTTETGDLATGLQKQFLAAILNILKGADPSEVEPSLNEASQWIDAHPPEVDMPAAEQSRGRKLAQEIFNYNNGITGPALCPDQPATPTPTPTLTPTPTPTSTAIPPSNTPNPTRTQAPLQGAGPGYQTPTPLVSPPEVLPTSTAQPAVPAQPTFAPPTDAPLPAVPTSGPTVAPTNPPPVVPTNPPPVAPTDPPPVVPTNPPPTNPPPPAPTAAPTDAPGNSDNPKPTKEPKPTKVPNP